MRWIWALTQGVMLHIQLSEAQVLPRGPRRMGGSGTAPLIEFASWSQPHSFMRNRNAWAALGIRPRCNAWPGGPFPVPAAGYHVYNTNNPALVSATS